MKDSFVLKNFSGKLKRKLLLTRSKLLSSEIDLKRQAMGKKNHPKLEKVLNLQTQ